jgi:hypothetical protein
MSHSEYTPTSFQVPEANARIDASFDLLPREAQAAVLGVWARSLRSVTVT